MAASFRGLDEKGVPTRVERHGASVLVVIVAVAAALGIASGDYVAVHPRDSPIVAAKTERDCLGSARVDPGGSVSEYIVVVVHIAAAGTAVVPAASLAVVVGSEVNARAAVAAPATSVEIATVVVVLVPVVLPPVGCDECGRRRSGARVDVAGGECGVYVHFRVRKAAVAVACAEICTNVSVSVDHPAGNSA